MKNIHSLKGEIRGMFSVMLCTTRGAVSSLLAVQPSVRSVIIDKDTKNRLIKQILGELFLYMGGGNLLIFK